MMSSSLLRRLQEDVAGFIRAFAGDHRYIVDYLVEEVLERQPPHVRTCYRPLFRSPEWAAVRYRNIYAKLQVRRRTEAVVRAGELGLM